MSQTVITLKVTQQELDLIDWYRARLSLKSRSHAIREAILHASLRSGLRATELGEIAIAREEHPPRTRVRKVVIRNGEIQTNQPGA